MFSYIEKYVIALGLIATFVVLAATWFLLRRLPCAIRSRFAKSWPLTDGRIETVHVRTLGEQALADLGYSYLVEGTRYSGYYSQQFADEQQAWDFVRRLQGQPVVVRYKRSDPGVAAFRTEDQRSGLDFKGVSLPNAIWAAFLSAARELYSSRRSEAR
jgi:hypothetical protein